MQCTRIISSIDIRIKNCRETTTILYARHIYSLLLLLEHVRHPHFRSLLKHHWRTNLFRYLYKKKKKNRARSSYSRAGPRERSSERKKKSAWLEITSHRERKKVACIRVGGEGEEKTKGSLWSKKGREQARDARLEDVRTRSVCVNPCSPYVLTCFSVYSDAFTLWSRLQRKKKIVLKLEDRRKGIYLRASESTTREAHGLGRDMW